MARAATRFGDRLDQAMKAAGITQTRLAVAVGTSQPAVSQWLAGRKEPAPGTLADLARALNVSRDWLADGVGAMAVAADAAAQRAEYAAAAGWGFRAAPTDGGRDFGNANVWSFKPTPEALVREVLQNAKDAAHPPAARVRVTFRLVTLAGDDLTAFQRAVGWDVLRGHLEAAAAGKQKFNVLLRDGLDRLDEAGGLLLLLVEDAATTGLTGPERGQGHFTALCRNNLDSNKDGAGAGGAFGLGKAVLWRAGRLSTVLFGSHLAAAQDGRSADRVFGRCELAWHELGGDEFAGPGWFGRLAAGEAESFWENAALADDLYLGRREAGTGTTACVVGFHDPTADADRPPVELARELVRATAVHFFPALAADKLAVTVEVYDSGGRYREGKPAFAQVVNPDDYVPAAVRMLRAFRDGAAAESLGDGDKDVAARSVPLRVPKRVGADGHPEREHQAVLLVTPADDEPAADAAEKPFTLSLFRGPGMVVERKSFAGRFLGARPFHALLLCGRAAEAAAPEVASVNEDADLAAERFLRTAEPPSHDEWTATPDLKAEYARGCKARLDEFLVAAGKALGELVKPPPPDTGDGPDALKELFRLGADPPPKPDVPRVMQPAEGSIDAEGRWRVTARIRLKPKKAVQRIQPAVYFLAETGTGTPVRWAELVAVKGGEVDPSGQWLVVPPDTREVRFEGATDPATHPIPAADSCVVVDVAKVVPNPKGGAA